MKVLIAGADGQVGRALAATVPAGWDLAALPRSELDIADPAAIDAAMARHSPDILVNVAAFTAVDRAEEEPEAAFRVNAKAVEDLSRACGGRNIRLVHFSTDHVFDGSQSTPYRPGDPTGPVNRYGESKLVGEKAALACPGHLVIRTSWVHSPHGDNFVVKMLKLMRQGGEIRVVSDQIGTPTHALSLARATWALAGLEASGIHHFTDDGAASRYDFAVAIQEEAREAGLLEGGASILPVTSAEYRAPARRPSSGLLDKSETWRLIGGPARHWRVELRAMLAELKGLPDG